MNLIHRAITCCPTCNAEHEVWLSRGKVIFGEVTECLSCGSYFKANEFISRLLELRKNTTLSAVTPSD